jgi:hypothetical protein
MLDHRADDVVFVADDRRSVDRAMAEVGQGPHSLLH